MAYEYNGIVDALLQWYDLNRRILPWRDGDHSPYHVWVSEIMLQQTRVEAVKEYFKRFINKLPKVEDLAAAHEEQLLKLWEGLGYYNRVRNMQKAAKIICESYKGELPRDVKELMKLPGIGPYTAGAIASIAYDEKVAAVDGNVLRIAMRLEASFEDIAESKVAKRVTAQLTKAVPNRAGDFNQALMDLGSMVCIPKKDPLCASCPLSLKCLAYSKGLVSGLPVKTTKNKRKIEEKTVFLIEYEGKYLLRKREKEGLLAGLWEFPTMEGLLSEGELKKKNLKEAEIVKALGSAKHIFSHIEWRMVGYLIRLNKQETEFSALFKDTVWATVEELKENYSIPSAFEAYKKEMKR